MGEYGPVADQHYDCCHEDRRDPCLGHDADNFADDVSGSTEDEGKHEVIHSFFLLKFALFKRRGSAPPSEYLLTAFSR